MVDDFFIAARFAPRAPTRFAITASALVSTLAFGVLIALALALA